MIADVLTDHSTSAAGLLRGLELGRVQTCKALSVFPSFRPTLGRAR